MPIPSSAKKARWYDTLSEDESRFVLRFILASGSLKELAETYGVSYPTIRSRLDSIIAILQSNSTDRTGGPLHTAVSNLVRADKLSAKDAREILDAYSKEQEGET